MGTTPISVLANNVQSRLEEVPGSQGAWWSRQMEIYSAISEAMNDLLLLVGRPGQVVNFPFALTPNTPWQTIPKGIMCVTDIQGAGSALYKISLWDLDVLQTAWGSDWQQDVGPVALQWCPIGFNKFVVHPAPAYPQTVNIYAISYPIQQTWPYDGTSTVPFEDNYFQLIEEYAAFYCRIKELGTEFQEGMKLFEQYMAGARRMTQIQDLRDPLLFTMGYGGSQNVNPTTKR